MMLMVAILLTAIVSTTEQCRQAGSKPWQTKVPIKPIGKRSVDIEPCIDLDVVTEELLGDSEIGAKVEHAVEKCSLQGKCLTPRFLVGDKCMTEAMGWTNRAAAEKDLVTMQEVTAARVDSVLKMLASDISE